jgi:hypothetical protein
MGKEAEEEGGKEMKQRYKKAFYGLIIASLLIGSILSIMFVYGAETINMEISGDNSADRFTASLTGDTFLGDTVSFGTFSYNWTTGVNNGEILIHTVKGLLTIKMSQGTYDDVLRTFTIPKFVIEYPQNYPYTITVDKIIGSYDTSTFTCYLVGRYYEGSSSPDPSGDCTGDCYDVDCDCDGDSVSVDLYLDKEGKSATITFRGADSSKYASMSGSGKHFFYDLAYTGSAPDRFTIQIYYKDGTDESTDSYSIGCSSGSNDNTWSGGGSTSTSSDYTKALAEAKDAGYTTVMEYIESLDKKVTDLTTTLTDRTNLLTTRNAEIETLKSDKTNIQNQLNNQQNTYNNYVQTHSYTNDQYNALLTGKPSTNTGGNGVSLPALTDQQKQMIGLGLLAVILLILWKKGKLPGIRKKKKFDPHEYNKRAGKNGNGNGIPQNGDERDEPEDYIVREDVQSDEELREELRKLEEGYKKIEERLNGR